MDFKTKELVGVYDYSDVNENRDDVKTVCINGRTYLKMGTVTATTVVALQYKVYNPSVKHSEYITLMGVARQNPGDITLCKEYGYEIAMENAMLNPVATFKFEKKADDDTIQKMMKVYVSGLPIRFVKTRAEIETDGSDINAYNRNTRNDFDYYSQYYNDWKKIFKRY